jgi:hypothetical protein
VKKFLSQFFSILSPLSLTPLIQNMKNISTSKFFYFIAVVADTTDKHSFANISANFRKKSKRFYWDTQGPGGGNCFMKKLQVENLVSDSLKNCLVLLVISFMPVIDTQWKAYSIMPPLFHCEQGWEKNLIHG